MPDSRDRNEFPQDWGDAFARLPLENAPADGWMRLQKQLPQARPRRHRWPLRIAVAAALVASVWLPWQSWHAGVSEPAPVTDTAAMAVIPTATTPIDTPLEPVPESTTPSPVATVEAEALPAATAPQPRPIVRDASPAQDGMQTGKAIARNDVPASTSLPPSESSGSTPQITPQVRLEALYAESAQLEAVLGQLQDDRVASGSLAALSDELQGQLNRIDVALSQSTVSDESRLDLWQQRVVTLRHLTGVEGTQRWMAANGRQELTASNVY